MTLDSYLKDNLYDKYVYNLNKLPEEFKVEELVALYRQEYGKLFERTE